MSEALRAGPGRLLGLGHVTVRSADFERTERFYCGLLGLRVGPRPAIAVPGRWFFLGDVAVVHVLPRAAEDRGGRSEPAGPLDHFAFDAEDLPAFEQRLLSAGQPFERRRLADSSVWQVFMSDPDGVRVELSFAMR